MPVPLTYETGAPGPELVAEAATVAAIQSPSLVPDTRHSRAMARTRRRQSQRRSVWMRSYMVGPALSLPSMWGARADRSSLRRPTS